MRYTVQGGGSAEGAGEIEDARAVEMTVHSPLETGQALAGVERSSEGHSPVEPLGEGDPLRTRRTSADLADHPSEMQLDSRGRADLAVVEHERPAGAHACAQQRSGARPLRLDSVIDITTGQEHPHVYNGERVRLPARTRARYAVEGRLKESETQRRVFRRVKHALIRRP